MLEAVTLFKNIGNYLPEYNV